MSDDKGKLLSAAAFSRSCLPGRCVGVWFSVEDSVWHEFVLLYPGSVPGSYVGLTPDGDVFEEAVTCTGDTCVKAFVCSDSGTAAPQARGQFYRFDEYPSASAFKTYVRDARKMTLDECKTLGSDPPAVPNEVLNMLGERVPFSDLGIGGAPPLRRVSP